MSRPLLSFGLPRASPVLEVLTRYKYSMMLGIIVLTHLVLIGRSAPHGVLLVPGVVSLLYFLGFLLIADRSILSWVVLGCGIDALAATFLNLAAVTPANLLVSVHGHIAFLFLLIVFLLRRLFAQRHVTVDSVMAGVIAYLMLGGLWTQLYGLVELVHPGSLKFDASMQGSPYALLYYFSITTLTTGSFGDITPATDLTRILAAYESLTGQVYLVVFIALLMGRHFANR